MVVAQDRGSSGLGSSPGCGHFVMFLGNTHLRLHRGPGRWVGRALKDGLASYLAERSLSVLLAHVQIKGRNLSEKWKITQTFTTNLSLPSTNGKVGKKVVRDL